MSILFGQSEEKVKHPLHEKRGDEWRPVKVTQGEFQQSIENSAGVMHETGLRSVHVMLATANNLLDMVEHPQDRDYIAKNPALLGRVNKSLIPNVEYILDEAKKRFDDGEEMGRTNDYAKVSQRLDALIQSGPFESKSRSAAQAPAGGQLDISTDEKGNLRVSVNGKERVSVALGDENLQLDTAQITVNGQPMQAKGRGGRGGA